MPVQAHYDIVYVTRTPQQSTGPTLAETGPVYGKLSWSANLYSPDTIEVVASTNELESDLKERLRDLVLLPTEIWIYRDGILVAAGPIVGGSINEKEVTISAAGLSSYLRYMFVTTDKNFSATDQATIAKTLVDDWQALDYGNFGIDTSSITTHGVNRTINFKGNEFPNVFEAVTDLGAADNGFDVWVDPDTRELNLDYPSRGVNKSATVFLERGISSPNIKFSVAPGIIASESFGVAKDTNGNVITSTQTNTTLRQDFGRIGYAESYEDGEQALLDDLTQAAVDVRNTMMFQPGPGLLPVDGAKVEDFNPGDIVSYLYDAGLGNQSGVYRVKRKKVTVDKGQESIEVEFE